MERITGSNSDIHGYSRRVKIAVASLAEISNDDRKLIEEFVEILKSQNISIARVAKYIYND